YGTAVCRSTRRRRPTRRLRTLHSWRRAFARPAVRDRTASVPQDLRRGPAQHLTPRLPLRWLALRLSLSHDGADDRSAWPPPRLPAHALAGDLYRGLLRVH